MIGPLSCVAITSATGPEETLDRKRRISACDRLIGFLCRHVIQIPTRD